MVGCAGAARIPPSARYVAPATSIDASAATATATPNPTRRPVTGAGGRSCAALVTFDTASSAKRDVAGRLEPLERILLEAAPNHALDRRRQTLHRSGQLRRILFQDRAHRLDGGAAGERAPAGVHLVEHRAEAEDVGPAVDVFAAQLLRRHVAGGAEDRPRIGPQRRGRLRRAGRARRHQLRQAEVENLRAAVPGDDHVLGLQIPVDDAPLVRRRQAIRDLRRVVGRFARGQAAGIEHLAKRLTVEQLRDDIGDAGVGADVVDDEDVGVIQRGGRARLLLEALQAVGVSGHRVGSTLSATSRSSRVSRARNTSPMPPAPIDPRIS